MKRLLFVYNPRAGRGEIRAHLSDVLEKLSAIGYDMTVYPTGGRMDAMRIVEERGGEYDLLVCSGGDGTLDETVTGMWRAGLQIPLGYIPTGSTNDFASSLGISKDVRMAAKSILSGKLFPCDIGKLNEEVFVYVAAFGVFTEVSYKTSQDWKNALGHLAYILEGVKSLSSVKTWRLHIESEEWSGDGEFLYGMITNSDSVGGFKGITGQDVTLNDGLFEVTLIKNPPNIIEWPGIINALLLREENDNIITFKTSKAEFVSEEELPWTRDGEYGGSFRQTVIENLPQAVKLIVPDRCRDLADKDTEDGFEEDEWSLEDDW